jgi:aryl-alcohol dehydrogenase-like predicted oxidoreductase
MTRLTRRSFHAVAASVAAMAATPMPARAAASDQRTLGKNGPKVSGVGLGCNNFGMRLDAAGAERVVHAAVDMGINFFDTADVYGRGASEEMLGKALGARRKNVLIATKFGSPMGTGKFPQGGGKREAVIALTEDCLRRLGTDVIDLMQYHRPDGVTPIEETIEAMADLVKQGKVRYIGHSNFDGAQTTAAAKFSADKKIAACVSAQNHYSLLTRGIEADLVPACVAHGVGILPYFPLESGMLTGKYKRGEKPAEDTRLGQWSARSPQAAERFMNDAALTKVEKLSTLAEANGTTVLHMAFGWLLNKPYIGSVIAGATRPEQIEANVKAATWRPSAGVDAEIDKITQG